MKMNKVPSNAVSKTLLRVGIDARLYSQAGVGRYLRNLISNLEQIDDKNEYFIFLLQADFNDLNFSSNFHKVKADIGWYGFKEQLQLPGLLNKYNLDLVHFPHFNIPIFYKGKFVVTIHDLIHQHFAMKRSTTHNFFIYMFKQIGYDLTFRQALRRSKKVITVSEYVKNLLTCDWKVAEDKVVVIKEAAEKKFSNISRKISKNKVGGILKKYKIEQPFIYYIGNAHPHKNVEGLIKAFFVLRKHYQYLKLVLSGHDHYFWERLKKENQHKDIIYTGYVSDKEAIAILKSASVYVQPSLEEGFGIPLLEAFCVGTAVASSNAASLPEVGGDAALYFDPKDSEDIASKVSILLSDTKKRELLIQKGYFRSKEFSWEKLARRTLSVYQEVFK